jgi:hypothetical protein
MHTIPSSLSSQEQEFVPVQSTLAERGFALGGNWDYDRGSFDCALDDAQKVWLRLPFEVTIGHLDGETEENDAKIRFGQPFVLKHVYQEGLDAEAQPRGMNAMFDQFQDPADPDDAIEPHWIDAAKQKLREAERLYPA